MKFAYLALFSTVLAGCAAQSVKNQYLGSLALTKEHFTNVLSVEDDSLEVTAKVSTRDGFVVKNALGVPLSDQFLRAYIDKSTGSVSYQAYVIIKHASGGWLNPVSANYGKPLVSEPVTRVFHDVSCNGSAFVSCNYTEHVVFDVSPQEVNRIKTATPEQAKTLPWAFRLKTQSGKNHEGFISLNEWQALIEYTETLSLNYLP